MEQENQNNENIQNKNPETQNENQDLQNDLESEDQSVINPENIKPSTEEQTEEDKTVPDEEEQPANGLDDSIPGEDSEKQIVRDNNKKEDEQDLNKPDFLLRYFFSQVNNVPFADLAKVSQGDVLHSLDTYKKSAKLKQMAAQYGLTVDDLYKQALTARKKIQTLDYTLEHAKIKNAIFMNGMDDMGYDIINEAVAKRAATFNESLVSKVLTMKGAAQAYGVKNKDGIFEDSLAMKGMWDVLTSSKMERMSRTIAEDGTLHFNTDKNGFFYMEDVDPSEELRTDDQLTTIFNSGISRHHLLDANRKDEPFINGLIRDVPFLNDYLAAVKFAGAAITGLMGISKSLGDIIGVKDHSFANSVENYLARFNFDKTDYAKEHPWSVSSIVHKAIEFMVPLKGMRVFNEGMQYGAELLKVLNPEKVGKVANWISAYTMSASFTPTFAKEAREKGIPVKDAAWMHLLLTGLMGEASKVTKIITDPLENARRSRMIQQAIVDKLSTFTAETFPKEGSEASANAVKDIWNRYIAKVKADKILKGTGKLISKLPQKAYDALYKEGVAMNKYFAEATPESMKWSALEFAEGFNTGGADMASFNLLEEGIKQAYNYLHKDKKPGLGRFENFNPKEFMRGLAISYLYGGLGAGLVHSKLGREFLKNEDIKEYRKGMTAYAMDGIGREIMETGLKNADYGSKELSVKKSKNGEYLKVDPKADDPLQKISQYDFNKNLIQSLWEMTKDRVDLKLSSLTPKEFKNWREASQKQFGDLLDADLTSIKQDLNVKFEETEKLTEELNVLKTKLENTPEGEKPDVEAVIKNKKFQIEQKDNEIKKILSGGLAGYYTQKYIYEHSGDIDKTVFPTFKDFQDELQKIFKIRDKMKEEYDKDLITAKETGQKIKESNSLEEIGKILKKSSILTPETVEYINNKFSEQQKKYQPLFEELYKAYSDELDRMELSPEEKEQNLSNLKRRFYDYGKSIAEILYDTDESYMDEDGNQIEDKIDFREFVPKELFAKLEQASNEYVGMDELRFTGKILRKFDNIDALYTVPESNQSLFMTPDFNNFIRVQNEKKMKELNESANKEADAENKSEKEKEADSENKSEEAKKAEEFDKIAFTLTHDALSQEPSEHLKILADRIRKRIALYENLNKLAGYSYLFGLDKMGGIGIEEFLPNDVLLQMMPTKIMIEQLPDMASKATIINDFMKNFDMSGQYFVEGLKTDLKYLDDAYKAYLSQKRTPIAELNTETANIVYREKTIISDVYVPFLDAIDTIPEIKPLINEIQNLANEINPIKEGESVDFDRLIKMDSNLVKMKVKLKQVFDIIAEHEKVADELSTVILKELRKNAGNLNFEHFNILASAERLSTNAFYNELRKSLENSNTSSAPTTEQKTAIHEVLGFVLNNIKNKQPGAKKGIMDLVFEKYQKVKKSRFPARTEMQRYSEFRHESYENMMFLHAAWGAGKTKYIAGNFLRIFQSLTKEKDLPYKIIATSGTQTQTDILVKALEENGIKMAHKGETISYKEIIKMLKNNDRALEDIGLIVYDESTFIPGGSVNQEGLFTLNKALKEYNESRETPLQIIFMGDEHQLGYMQKNPNGYYDETNIGQILTIEKSSYIYSSMRTSVISISDFLNELKSNYRDPKRSGQNNPYQTSYGMTPENEYAGVRVVDYKERNNAMDEMVHHMNEEGVKELIYITDLKGDDFVKLKNDLSNKYTGLNIKVIHVSEIQGNEGKYVVIDFRNMGYKQNDPIYEEFVMRSYAVSVSRAEQFALILNSSNRLWTSREGSQTVRESGLREEDFAEMKENTIKILENSVNDVKKDKIIKGTNQKEWSIPVTIKTPETAFDNENISFDKMFENLFNYERKEGSLKGLFDKEAEEYKDKLKEKVLMIYQHLANKAQMGEEISVGDLATFMKKNNIIFYKEEGFTPTDDYFKNLAEILINGERKIGTVKMTVKPINGVKFTDQATMLKNLIKEKLKLKRFENKEDGIHFENEIRTLRNSINIKLKENTISPHVDSVIEEILKDETLFDSEMKKDADFIRKIAESILYGKPIPDRVRALEVLKLVFETFQDPETGLFNEDFTLENLVEATKTIYEELQKKNKDAIYLEEEFIRAVYFLKESWDQIKEKISDTNSDKDELIVDHNQVVKNIMNGQFTRNGKVPKTKEEAIDEVYHYYNNLKEKGVKSIEDELMSALNKIKEIFKNDTDGSSPDEVPTEFKHETVLDRVLKGDFSEDGTPPKTLEEAIQQARSFYGKQYKAGNKWAESEFHKIEDALKKAWAKRGDNPTDKPSPNQKGPKENQKADYVIKQILNGDLSPNNKPPKVHNEAIKLLRAYYGKLIENGNEWAEKEFYKAKEKLKKIWEERLSKAEKSSVLKMSPDDVVDKILKGELFPNAKKPKTKAEALKQLDDFYKKALEDFPEQTAKIYQRARKLLEALWEENPTNPEPDPNDNKPVNWSNLSTFAYSWVKNSSTNLDKEGILKIKNDILFGDGLNTGRYILKLKLRNAQETKDIDIDLSTHTLEDLYIEVTDKNSGHKIVLLKFPYQGKSAKRQHNIDAINRFIAKYRPLLEGNGIEITDSFIRNRPKHNEPYITTVRLGTPGSKKITLGELRHNAELNGVFISSDVYLMRKSLEAKKGTPVVYYSSNFEELQRFEEAINNKKNVDIKKYPQVHTLILYSEAKTPNEIFNSVLNRNLENDKIQGLDIETIINGNPKNIRSPRGRLIEILTDIQKDYPEDKALVKLINHLKSDSKSSDLLINIKSSFNNLSKEVKDAIKKSKKTIFTSVKSSDSSEKNDRSKAFNSNLMPLNEILFVNSKMRGISSSTFYFEKSFWESIEKNNVKEAEKILSSMSKYKNSKEGKPEPGNSQNSFQFSDALTSYLNDLPKVDGKSHLDFATDAFHEMRNEMSNLKVSESNQKQFFDLAEKYVLSQKNEHMNALIDFVLDELPEMDKFDKFMDKLTRICS